MSIKDYISIILSALALFISSTTLYRNQFRKEYSLAFSIARFPDTSGFYGASGNPVIDFTFANSGNVPVIITNIAWYTVVDDNVNTSNDECKGNRIDTADFSNLNIEEGKLIAASVKFQEGQLSGRFPPNSEELEYANGISSCICITYAFPGRRISTNGTRIMLTVRGNPRPIFPEGVANRTSTYNSHTDYYDNRVFAGNQFVIISETEYW